MFSLSKVFISALVVLSVASGTCAASGRSVTRRSRLVRRQDSSPVSYVLADDYRGDKFFDAFDFFTGNDPTHGKVNYVSREAAEQKGLVNVDGDQVVLSADMKSSLPPGTPRDSVRVSSKKKYNGHVLFAFDVKAMPYGCSTWPALWLLGGSTWPQGGEIDVLEGVNNGNTNQYTLHTTEGCSIGPTNGRVTGSPSEKTSCASSGSDNSGCAFHDGPGSYGKDFNAGGGGVFAVLMDAQGIRIWRFTRDQVPEDLKSGQPTLAKWGDPTAHFAAATCPTEKHFHDLSIIINITFCGDWAGSAYGSSGCPGTCEAAVANPENFKFAQWKMNSIKVYKPGDAPKQNDG